MLGDTQNKTDYNSLVGFLLIALLFGGYFWWSAKNAPEPAVQPKNKTEQTAGEEKSDTEKVRDIQENGSAIDSASTDILERVYGSFSGSAIASGTQHEITLENELLKLSFSRKGGFASRVELKNFQTYKKTPLYLIADGNSRFNLGFTTRENKKINTEELYFVPSLTETDSSQILSMRLYSMPAGKKFEAYPDEYLEFVYELKNNSYALDFDIRTNKLGVLLDKSSQPMLHFSITANNTEKGKKFENQYTNLSYALGKTQKVKNLPPAGTRTKEFGDLSWFAFKQRFFSTILRLEEGLAEAKLASEDLPEDEGHTKKFTAELSLPYSGGDMDSEMNLYFGQNMYKTLRAQGNNYYDILPLGWTIIGWINRFLVIPTFNILNSKWGLGMGFTILVMTLMIRLLVSFFTYRSYISSAKMRLLKPEVDEINQKYKDDAKKQQATMELYNKAGVNPLAGCLPMLLQMPFFIAMYRFFPSAIELRGQKFLWADDLSAYDSILDFSFNIPFYGDHISLFTLLMAGALILQTRMGGDMQPQQQQPGMPNMKVIMYIMPVMMLLWFNSYAAGLTYYYFLSTIFAIIMMWVIRKYIVDEEKLHARLQLNKAAAEKKGPSKWQAKYNQLLKDAEEQNAIRQNRQQRRMNK